MQPITIRQATTNDVEGIKYKMKNSKPIKEKAFDTVKFFRAVKEKIAIETKGMTFLEFKQYINNRKLKTAK